MFNFLKKHKLPLNSPTFLIIGAQKAGTTTLYDILNNINIFNGSKIKEVGFFSKDYFYSKGNSYYFSQFENNKTLSFEATPEYLYYDFVPKRIFKFNKNMKFIVLLREPASRCYSAWNMFRTFNQNNPDEIYNMFTKYANPEIKKSIKSLLFTKSFPSFANYVKYELSFNKKMILSREPSFIARGIYIKQIENYLKYFSIDNFLFIEQRELNNQKEIVARICTFLNVTYNGDMINNKNSNIGIYTGNEEENKDTFDFLKEFYRSYNEDLFKLIGKRYDWND